MEIKLNTDLLLQLQEAIESGQQSTDPTVNATLSKLSSMELAGIKKILAEVAPACFCNKAQS